MPNEQISELDCRILAKACGLCWHEWKQDLGDASVSCIHCGVELLPETKVNPTFTTPDDWELVRVKVVRDYRGVFVEFILDDGITAIRWWLTQSPEELCRLAADFIKSHPGLFPWVVELIPMDWLMMEEKR